MDYLTGSKRNDVDTIFGLGNEAFNPGFWGILRQSKMFSWNKADL